MERLIPLLNVKDVAKSIAFYSGILSFSVDREFSRDEVLTWASLSLDGIEIMLNRSPGRAERPPRVNPRSYDDVVFCCRVAAAEAVHRALSTADASPRPISAEEYGFLEFTVRDPDGYELAFQQSSV